MLIYSCLIRGEKKHYFNKKEKNRKNKREDRKMSLYATLIARETATDHQVISTEIEIRSYLRWASMNNK